MSDGFHAITMPRWGMTMKEGTVAAWLVEEGQVVSEGDEVVEIETTKITNVMEVAASGVLRRRLVQQGATVPVGTLLGIIAGEDVADDEIDAFVAEQAERLASLEDADLTLPAPHVVDANGCRINVLTMGEGGGASIALLHGFGGDLNSWLFNQPVLAEERAVQALDLPGHGGSDVDVGDGSLGTLASAFLAALDALGATAAHVVGHSLGGAVAIRAFADAPERVRSLTLIAPVGLGEEINAHYIEGFLAAERRRPMMEALGLLFADADAVSRQMANDLLQHKRRDGVPEALRAIADAVFPNGRQGELLRNALAGVDIPAQVIWGALDQVIPPSQVDGLPTNIAVHVIDDAGHMPHMEQPSAVNRLIRDIVHAAEEDE